jgi:uncharacterized protein (DUF1810 family)
VPTESSDPFDLSRFVDAQEGVYETVLRELEDGQKRSHWMWFIFPQTAGLGLSSMAQRYAITSRREAKAYLEHPVLGPRLNACCSALLQVEGRSAEEIMGYPDFLKLKSSMTLFATVSDGASLFSDVLKKYFSDQPDLRTIELLRGSEEQRPRN